MVIESAKSSHSESRQWQDFRDQMAITQSWAYFDHAAVAPLPLPTKQAMVHWLDEATSEGDAIWPAWSQRLEALRGTVANAVNAIRDQIAFVPNTTAGLNLLAEGFPWQSGDNVVTLSNEFPSNLYPWMHLADRGVTTKQITVDRGRVDLDAVAAACDDRTRVVTMSWVGYASGWRINVAEAARLAHDHGAIFCLDAIQGLGIYPLDVQATGVDFLAADGHKWLLGPEGAGVCYLSADLLDRLRPVGVGWNSVESRYDFANADLRIRRSAARYEGGSVNMVGFHGLSASVDLLVNYGWGPENAGIAERVIWLADILVEKLVAIGCSLKFERQTENKSAIVTFQVPGVSPSEVRSACFASKVNVSCRGGGVRVAPHAYNNEEDVDRLVQVIRRLL